MSKKQKKNSPKTKEIRKAPAAPTPEPSLVAEPTMAESEPAAQKKNERPMLRAIKVSPALLDAAKAYKRATGVSFYQLGLEAITERLRQQGYLEQAAEPKP